MTTSAILSKEEFQRILINTKLHDILLNLIYEIFLEGTIEHATFDDYSVLEFSYFTLNLFEKADELNLIVEHLNGRWFVSKK